MEILFPLGLGSIPAPVLKGLLALLAFVVCVFLFTSLCSIATRSLICKTYFRPSGNEMLASPSKYPFLKVPSAIIPSALVNFPFREIDH
jgi:hypothetical protein